MSTPNHFRSQIARAQIYQVDKIIPVIEVCDPPAAEVLLDELQASDLVGIRFTDLCQHKTSLNPEAVIVILTNEVSVLKKRQKDISEALDSNLQFVLLANR